MTIVTLDGLDFELRRSSNRRTMEIVVDREGELRFYAPEDCSEVDMDGFVREKRDWILDKLAEKERLNPPRSPKEYVSGETFFYLGRTHRLLLVDDQDVALKLIRGRFCLRRSSAPKGRRHFVRWYSGRGKQWLPSRAEPFVDRLGIHGTDIQVRDLRNRWGSCTKKGVVNIHWATMQVPPRVIDYLLVHELAHVLVHDHSPHYWRIVERILPDYKDRRRWLAENGAEFVRI